MKLDNNQLHTIYGGSMRHFLTVITFGILRIVKSYLRFPRFSFR